ncbi:MAG: zinc metallopeptidase [Clostridia bacterium]|nr:zinc metallopeptidase [Clostridia bacterium]
MFDFYVMYWLLGIILLPGIALAIWAQAKVSSTYKKTKEIKPLSTDKTGDQIAREILDKHELYDITVESVSGEMTDHYDPRHGKIALSEGVYGHNTIASLSIATHEVGHAIQRKEGHFATKLRTWLVPIINISDKILWPLIFIGIIFNVGAGTNSLVGNIFLWCGIAFFGLAVLFSLVTLPTELDASKRALEQLKEGGYLTNEEEIKQAKSMLRAAALTYVASLLVSILTLVRFVATIFILRNNE